MKVGIAISGGGYRATTYSLGVFSYLNHLQLEGKPLLQHVEALSTVSGGSITGITYALAAKNNVPFDDYFNKMYTFITKKDLVSSSISNFVDSSTKKSLIEGFSTAYDEELFSLFAKCTCETDECKKKCINKPLKFRSIIPAPIPSTDANKKDSIEYDSHIKYNCINATDFNTGTPFRFIAKSPEVQTNFIFGNNFHRIKKNEDSIELNLALAASSCFPGGFEPIIFDLQKIDPNIICELSNDFDIIYEQDRTKYKNKKAAKDKYVKKYANVSLMDGGIVDNQGIESIIRYNDSLKNEERKEISKDLDKKQKIEIDSIPNITEDQKKAIIASYESQSAEKFKVLRGLDLIMAIDVSSPSFTRYKETDDVNIPIIGNIKMIYLLNITMVLNALFFAGLVYSQLYLNSYATILFTFLTTLFTLVSSLLIIGKKIIKKESAKNDISFGDVQKMNILTPNTAIQLAKNRFASLGLLVGSVFMKHLRRQNIASLFGVQELRNKSIHNAIFQLKTRLVVDKKVSMTFLDVPKRFNQPTRLIEQICTNAFNMNTSLWVSKDEKGEKLVQQVLIAGQITTCANMLDYCVKNKALYKDKKNLSSKDQIVYNAVEELYDQVYNDWNNFIENPYWLLEKNAEITRKN